MANYINGVKYPDGSVTIINGKVIINGVDMTPNDKVINIKIEGNVDALDIDYCNTIDVKGDVKNICTTSGDVNVTGNVTGDIQITSGDIDCKDVGGNIQSTSGDIECNNVQGNVRTVSGDIEHK